MEGVNSLTFRCNTYIQSDTLNLNYFGDVCNVIEIYLILHILMLV